MCANHATCLESWRRQTQHFLFLSSITEWTALSYLGKYLLFCTVHKSSGCFSAVVFDKVAAWGYFTVLLKTRPEFKRHKVGLSWAVLCLKMVTDCNINQLDSRISVQWMINATVSWLWSHLQHTFVIKCKNIIRLRRFIHTFVAPCACCFVPKRRFFSELYQMRCHPNVSSDRTCTTKKNACMKYLGA